MEKNTLFLTGFSVSRVANCLLPTPVVERHTCRAPPPQKLPRNDVGRILSHEAREPGLRKARRAFSLIQLRQSYPTCLSQSPSYPTDTGNGNELPLWRRMPPNPAAPDTGRLGRRQGPPVDIDDDEDSDRADEARWEERWRARHGDMGGDGPGMGPGGMGDFDGTGRRPSPSSSSSTSGGWERTKKPRKRASLSEDHREKISAAMKGQRVGVPLSASHRARIKRAMQRKMEDPALRARISLKLKGRTRVPCCSICGNTGHNRRGCPTQSTGPAGVAAIGDGEGGMMALTNQMAPVTRRRAPDGYAGDARQASEVRSRFHYRCSICQGVGHNRLTCPDRKKELKPLAVTAGLSSGGEGFPSPSAQRRQSTQRLGVGNDR